MSPYKTSYAEDIAEDILAGYDDGEYEREDLVDGLSEAIVKLAPEGKRDREYYFDRLVDFFSGQV